RVSATGECRRSEVPVDLPQGPRGEQGPPGERGAAGADATAETLRCFQRLTAGVDLRGCKIPTDDLGAFTNLDGANLSGSTFVNTAPPAHLGDSRGYGHCAFNWTEVKCWGGLGGGSIPVPADIDATQVVDVQSGVQTSCALMKTGALRCWGGPGYGQNTTPQGLGPIEQLAVGDVHTCVLTRAGQVMCWGIGRAGIQQVPDALGRVTQLVSGGDYACALNSAGEVSCWGWTPRVPTGLPRISRLFAGYNNVCAIDEDEHAHCWGTDASTLGANFPSDLGPVRSMSGGVGSLCAVSVTNSLRCWGGFVGNLAGVRDGSEALPPADLGPVTEVSAGVFHTCAITTGMRVRCWGNDQAAAGDFTMGRIETGVISMNRTNVEGASLEGLVLASGSGGCGIVGKPSSLPAGWNLAHGCLEQAM
ncbi:MAG: hypothetical protein KGN78_14315, partial [Actinomycetales bacterium]|nr:hypothetical protein [Actinomycetales bacterium]